jgi:hypothetical protein
MMFFAAESNELAPIPVAETRTQARSNSAERSTSNFQTILENASRLDIVIFVVLGRQ